MHSSLFAIALAGLVVVHAALPVPGTTGELGPAEIVEGNPAGVTYTAILPNKNTTTIRGYVAGTSASNGTGVNFNINLYGFPSSDLGPFSMYPLAPLAFSCVVPLDLRGSYRVLLQSITFTTSLCLLMATAPAPKPILIRTFAARNPRATTRILQIVKSVTFLASMAILLAVPSKRRKFVVSCHLLFRDHLWGATDFLPCARVRKCLPHNSQLS